MAELRTKHAFPFDADGSYLPAALTDCRLAERALADFRQRHLTNLPFIERQLMKRSFPAQQLPIILQCAEAHVRSWYLTRWHEIALLGRAA